MIKNGRSTGCTHKHRDATAGNQGFRMIDCDAVAADQFNDVRPERRAPLKGPNCRLKVLGRHGDNYIMDWLA